MFEALVSSYIDVVVPSPIGKLDILLEDVKLGKIKPKPNDPLFQKVIEEVNKAKDKLGILYELSPPSARNIMYDVDLYTETKRDLKTTCSFEVSTNASLKMLEMTVHHNLVGKILKRKKSFLAFHNAELPGAFIMSLKKYMEYKYPYDQSLYDWRACSYYPEAAKGSKNPEVLGDSYRIYANNRKKWLMGPKPNGLLGDKEVSGDMTDRKTLEELGRTMQSLGGADLYTSDIGIDVTKSFNLQEDLTSILNYGQIVCGLMTLADQGTLLVKTYTFSKQFSRSLIILLSYLFEKTHITKPTTSRPANSEIYLVAEGFKKFLFTDEIQEHLLELLEFYEKKIHSDENPTNFGPIVKLNSKGDNVILLATNLIHLEQEIRVLLTAVALYYSYKNKNFKKLGNDILSLKKKKSEEYIQKNLF